ncbi:uncharacterized protein LOC135831402 [Planococcus citri]|uniref:uncharacterized protein LOC135831402 n=1 Tax=Planococcus citri TaxID=170843 RepID=UPI0031F7F60D
MKRQVVEVMAALLRFTGIHSEEGKATTLNELRRISVYVFFLSYGFLGTTMFSIKNGGEFYNFVIPTAYIGALTVLMTGVLCLFHNKKRIYRMLKHLDDNVFTYSDEVNIQPKYTWLFDEKNIITKFILVMCYEITGYIFVCGSPFMGYFVTGHMKPEIYPGWTPWTVNGTVTFWMTYVSQVCVVTTSLWGYYITLTYVLFIIIEFIKQYKRLVVAVSTINLRAERSLLEKLNFSNAFNESALGDITFQRANFHHSDIKKEHIVLYNRLVRENIIMCVKHHQMLKKTFNLFKPWFTVAFSIELGACMSTYALVFYCLLEVGSLVFLLKS